MSTTENNSGWRSILTHGVVYKLVQFIFSERRSKQLILDEFVNPAGANCNVLDIGCGPGNLLSFLPTGVNYTGFDLSEEYIELAKRKFKNRSNTQFISSSASGLMTSDKLIDESIDVAIIHGVLHHVSDSVVEEMFILARKKLKPGGRMVVLEPVWFDGQSKIRKSVMLLDRGNNIKQKPDWENLFDSLTNSWATSSSRVEQNLIRFYDLLVLSVSKNTS